MENCQRFISSSTKTRVISDQAHAMVRDELMVNLKKFYSAVERTVQQIDGEVRLFLPEMPALADGQGRLGNRTYAHACYTRTVSSR